ncbi:alpha/beta fold hydrolase, partial [Ideonella livida]
APPVAPAPAPALSLQPCRLPGLATAVRCGTLARPLDPADPHGTQITLQVAVLPALARQPRPDPLLFLVGGPGQSAVELAATLQALVGPLGQQRDLVLVDQRGTGRSAPLRCPALEQPATAPLSQQLAGTEAQARALAACRQDLERLPGGRLTAYGTAQAAADLEAVRQALGVAQWNVIGVSYGTRLALELLRQQPQTVRRLVLDGVAPAGMGLPDAAEQDAQAALDGWLAACAADPACHQAHPRLGARWQAWLARLPQTFTLAHPLTGTLERVRLDAEQVAGLLRAPLYQPALAAGLPRAMEAAMAGRPDGLLGLAASLQGTDGGPGLYHGLHYAVVCQEDMAPLPTGARPGPLRRQYETLCRGWPTGAPPAPLPPSPAPVMLWAGGDDPVTPPRHALRVAQALGPKARLEVMTHGGHGLLSHPCVADRVRRFIQAPDEAAALRVSGALGAPPAGGSVPLTAVAWGSCSLGLPRPLPLTDGARPRQDTPPPTQPPAAAPR